MQVAHHLGFPAFALHNIISGCAVPGAEAQKLKRLKSSVSVTCRDCGGLLHRADDLFHQLLLDRQNGWRGRHAAPSSQIWHGGIYSRLLLSLQIQIGAAKGTDSEVLRGAFVLLLDFRAVFNDQSALPYASWLVQAHDSNFAIHERICS